MNCAVVQSTTGGRHEFQTVVILEEIRCQNKKKNRNVGIIGIGQTEYSSHTKKPEIQLEMINEAVRAALADANITLDQIDCVVHGNMELFEMVHQPDMWHVLGTGALGKSYSGLQRAGHHWYDHRLRSR